MIGCKQKLNEPFKQSIRCSKGQDNSITVQPSEMFGDKVDV